MDAFELSHRDLSARVIGAFYETYNELGHGFLESVYENSFAIQLESNGLSIKRQQPIVVKFRGQVVGELRADMIVEDRLLVEVKAVAALLPAHDAQLINYLKATRIHLGLLLNFGPRAQPKNLLERLCSIRVHPCNPWLKECSQKY